MRVQGLQHALTWQRRGADLHRQAAGQASSRRDRSVPERRLQGQVKPAIAASPREMNVGWIGTGKLVLPMAARIAAALQSEGLEFEALRNYPICVALAPDRDQRGCFADTFICKSSTTCGSSRHRPHEHGPKFF